MIALVADVGRALTTRKTLAEMLSDCAEALVKHLEAAFARIWILDAAGEVLELQASAGLYTHLDGPHGRVPLGQFKIGQIAQERRAHLTNSVIGDPRVSDQEWARREGMAAFAGYPLVVDERLVGVAAVFARQPLSDVTLQAMGSVADQIAVGIDRRRAEGALRESEARKGTILEAALDCIITIDDQQRIIEWNPAAERTFGYPRSQALGRHLAGLIIPSSLRGAHLQGFAHYLATGEGPILNTRVEVAALHAEGREFPVELTIVPIRLQGRSLFTAYLRDVTERRQAEQALRQSEQRYKSLFDYNPDAVFSFDLTGHFLSANAACEAVSGYTPGELLQTAFMPLIVPEDLARVLSLFHRAARGEPQTFETMITHKTGDRISLAVTIVPTIVDEAIVGVFGIAEDITVRKRAETLEREAHLHQRAFLRDVLASITESKLLLVDTPEQLPLSSAPIGEAIALSQAEGLRELRHRTQEAAQEAGHTEERQYDMITAASEAGMNAITHGGGHGTAWVSVSKTGTVQVRVEDQGAGIAMENLPRATLARGFSTKATLGHGLKMILETIDRLYLLTGPSGTTVVIEQDRVAPIPVWLAEAIQ